MPRRKRTQEEILAGRRARFVRVAEPRTQAVLDALDSLAACAVKSMYEYSQQDAETILAAIESKVSEVRQAFEEGRPNRFHLETE